MALKINFEGMDWINLDQDREDWVAFMKAKFNFGIYKMLGVYLLTEE
jgi:hypothetical protein